jgi:N-acetylglutamate synthase/N-acetylornithine aminotransferase
LSGVRDNMATEDYRSIHAAVIAAKDLDPSGVVLQEEERVVYAAVHKGGGIFEPDVAPFLPAEAGDIEIEEGV